MDAFRRAIAVGEVGPRAFRQWLCAHPPAAWDRLADEVLDLDPWQADGPELPKGCVPYLAAPVASLLQLIDGLGLSEQSTFADLGCGVGRAALLVHLLTGANVLGLDVQSQLVERANTAAARLEIRAAKFTVGDMCAPSVHMPVADTYFMYCPFGGQRIIQVLDRLEARAKAATTAIGCLQLTLPPRAWLCALPSAAPALRLYRSQTPT